MQPFHQFSFPKQRNSLSNTEDKPVSDSISYQEEPITTTTATTNTVASLSSNRPRRNTVGSCNAAGIYDSSSSSSCYSSSDESNAVTGLVTERRTKSWYEGLLGSIKSNVIKGGESDPSTSSRRREGKTKRMKRALDDIIRLCPEDNRTELERSHVSLIRQKMNDTIVTIGICGEPESGRRTLLNVLQHSKNHTISSPDARIAFKLCPYIHSSLVTDDSTGLDKEFRQSLVSCSGYLCVVSCDQLTECSTCTELLEILLQRDKDIFNQRRALMIANKFDMFFTRSDTSTTDSRPSLTPLPFSPPPSLGTTRLNGSTSTGLSSHSSSEYLHYDRFSDHEDFEQFVKLKLAQHIKYNTGIVLPDTCITATMLKWSQLSRDYHRSIEEGEEVEEQLQEWLDLHEPYRSMTSDIRDMTNEQLFEVITGIAVIEAWVEKHVENTKTLKNLSILSDTIYCIHYCIDKLQGKIDTCTMKIENLESLQVQRTQLMNELSRLYNWVSSYKRDASLFDSLMKAYDKDIQEPLERIRKLAHKLIDRFKEMSITKLNRLIHCNFEHMSVEALQETCELDIASFSRGATNKLKGVLRTVVFRNMHGVLPFKLIKDNSQELTKLGEHLLKEHSTSLEMNSLEECPSSYHHDDYTCYSRMSCTNGLELYYPVTLDAVSAEGDSLKMIASELHPHFYSMLHFHSATIKTLESQTDEEEKDSTPIKYKHLGEEVKDNFIKHCERYLDSEELKRKAVQFHMEIMNEYISNFLEQFDKKYRHKLEAIQLQMNNDVKSLKESKEKSEYNLKEIITLKVDLELLRAELLTNNY